MIYLCFNMTLVDDLVVRVPRILVNQENEEQEANRQLSYMYEFTYILCTNTEKFDHRKKNRDESLKDDQAKKFP